ncbi:hypothetical protein [Streptomyces lannensis]|uniref:hypothetical protein n=1 Tax=Streptomyces TaxID=1883 RepID=UPI0031EF5C64
MVDGLDDIEVVDGGEGLKATLGRAVITTVSSSEMKDVRGDGGLVGLLLDALACDDERCSC